MSFPNLTLRTDNTNPAGVATHYAEATGVPVNGANTFALPFVPAGVDPETFDGDWLEIDVDPTTAPSSVTGVTEGIDPVDATQLLNAAKTNMTLDFVQGGVNPVTVRVRILHSLIR